MLRLFLFIAVSIVAISQELVTSAYLAPTAGEYESLARISWNEAVQRAMDEFDFSLWDLQHKTLESSLRKLHFPVIKIGADKAVYQMKAQSEGKPDHSSKLSKHLKKIAKKLFLGDLEYARKELHKVMNENNGILPPDAPFSLAEIWRMQSEADALLGTELTKKISSAVMEAFWKTHQIPRSLQDIVRIEKNAEIYYKFDGVIRLLELREDFRRKNIAFPKLWDKLEDPNWAEKYDRLRAFEVILSQQFGLGRVDDENVALFIGDRANARVRELLFAALQPSTGFADAFHGLALPSAHLVATKTKINMKEFLDSLAHQNEQMHLKSGLYSSLNQGFAVPYLPPPAQSPLTSFIEAQEVLNKVEHEEHQNHKHHPKGRIGGGRGHRPILKTELDVNVPRASMSPKRIGRKIGRKIRGIKRGIKKKMHQLGKGIKEFGRDLVPQIDIDVEIGGPGKPVGRRSKDRQLRRLGRELGEEEEEEALIAAELDLEGHGVPSKLREDLDEIVLEHEGMGLEDAERDLDEEELLNAEEKLLHIQEDELKVKEAERELEAEELAMPRELAMDRHEHRHRPKALSKAQKRRRRNKRREKEEMRRLVDAIREENLLENQKEIYNLERKHALEHHNGLIGHGNGNFKGDVRGPLLPLQPPLPLSLPFPLQQLPSQNHGLGIGDPHYRSWPEGGDVERLRLIIPENGTIRKPEECQKKKDKDVISIKPSKPHCGVVSIEEKALNSDNKESPSKQEVATKPFTLSNSPLEETIEDAKLKHANTESKRKENKEERLHRNLKRLEEEASKRSITSSPEQQGPECKECLLVDDAIGSENFGNNHEYNTMRSSCSCHVDDDDDNGAVDKPYAAFEDAPLPYMYS